MQTGTIVNSKPQAKKQTINHRAPMSAKVAHEVSMNSDNSVTQTLTDVNGKTTPIDMDDNDIDFLAEAAQSLITPDQAKAESNTKDLSKFLLSAGAHDEGNAQCVHFQHNGKFAHNDANGWLAYDGRKWVQDGAEAILDRSIVHTLESRVRAVVNSKQMERYSQILKKSIPSAGAVSGTKALMQSLTYTSVDAFDNDPDKLNCLNGAVDLRTGKIEPHSPEHKFTHCTRVGYNPNADQSVWKDWLVASVGQERADYLQLAVGYSLTGHTYEEVLFYLFGPPRSGKGTFTETLIGLFTKPLATEVTFSTFTAQRTGDSQNFDLAPLKPCRFVAASESNAYERFNEAKVKALTGGNEIYCAFKHKTHFGYKPQFKIWLSSNQPVNADPDDDATWGRIRVIEFGKSNLGKEDKRLKRRMKSAETMEGVLAWAIEGAMKWYALGDAGLPELESSRTIKDKQRSDIDNVQAWIDECCIVGSALFVSNAMLYLSYEKWSRDNGVEPKKQKSLSQSLIKKGFASKSARVDDKVVRGFSGFGLP
jgi:putative DNA primase/helicase